MSEEGDDAQLTDLPIVEVPVKMDYGYNVKYVLPSHPCSIAVSLGPEDED